MQITVPTKISRDPHLTVRDLFKEIWKIYFVRYKEVIKEYCLGPTKMKKESTSITKDYKPTIVQKQRPTEEGEVSPSRKMTNLQRIGKQLDEILYDDDYEFPQCDNPVGLFASTTFKERKIKLNIYYPEVQIYSREDSQKPALLKSLFIGKNYAKFGKPQWGSDSEEETKDEPLNNEMTMKEIFTYMINHFNAEFNEFGK